MKAVKICQQDPMPGLFKFPFLEWSNGNILHFLKISFRFWLFHQLLCKIFFDSTSQSLYRSKIRIFGCDGLLIWLPLLYKSSIAGGKKCTYRWNALLVLLSKWKLSMGMIIQKIEKADSRVSNSILVHKKIHWAQIRLFRGDNRHNT